jgi:hypothetical protein
MSDYLHYAKTGGKFALDVVGGQGAVVGFVDATGYYYASSALNAILQAQFQASGWPQGTSKVANNGDVKGAIMFARDKYYAKAKSNLGGAFFDLAKGFVTDGLLAVMTGGWSLGWYAVKGAAVALDGREAYSKYQTAKGDISSFTTVPTAPEGPAKTAARALTAFSYGQKKFNPKSKNQAAFDAIGYILGTEFSAYRGQEAGYATRDGAVNRIAAWLGD